MARRTLRERLRLEGYEDRTIDAILLTGRVRIRGEVEKSGAKRIADDETVTVTESESTINRAYKKLDGAIERIETDVTGRVCVDLGASHGGFTKCLLDRGASRVYAVDVAYGILDYSLRKDSRVVVLERTNARDINKNWFLPDDIGSGEDLFITGDLSFISLVTVLRSLADFFKTEKIKMEGLLLLKPQFEASHLTERGIIRDDRVRESIVSKTTAKIEELGYKIHAVIPSSLTGTRGNQEYLVSLEFIPL